MKLITAAQAAAAAVVATRLARGRQMRPPLRTGVPLPPGSTVSAIIPARDEAGRIGPCVLAARADPGVSEVIVVDDESTDGTAAVAARAGARVIPGLPLPPGWVGKQWALQQGLEVASGEYVLTLDADTRPRPGLAAALVTAAAQGPFDLVSAGPRFVCDSVAEQGLHAAMLATLVYRFGPIGPNRQPRPHRVVVNGQCLLARRAGLAAAGGFAPVRGHLTDDIALARDLARRGWRIGFLDGRDLLDVDMHASAAEVWREWGRSLPMTDVTSPADQAADLAVLALTTALPLARLAAGRPTALDLGLLAMRVSLLGPLHGCYASPGPGLYLSPLADVAALIRMAGGTIRPVRSWRGRRYPVSRAPSRRRVPARSRCGRTPRARMRPFRCRAASAAIPNRTPMSDISAPVAATSRAGVKINCRNGTANTPARAPIANDLASRATAAQSATPSTKAGGQMTAKPPAKVSTLRPPRSRAKTGHACPIMAAATAAYTRATPPGARPPRIPCTRTWPKPRAPASGRAGRPQCPSACPRPAPGGRRPIPAGPSCSRSPGSGPRSGAGRPPARGRPAPRPESSPGGSRRPRQLPRSQT